MKKAKDGKEIDCGIKPEDPCHEANNYPMDVEHLKRCFWVAKELILLMKKRTDLGYDKKLKEYLNNYVIVLEGKLFAQGVKDLSR